MSDILNESNMLSVGIYTPAEAAKLLRLPRARLQRWIKGYKYKSPKKPDLPYFGKEPVVRPMLPSLDGQTALTFLELIELLFVKIFSERGISLQYIRRAAIEASQIFETNHPFALKHSLKHLYTDGKYILVSLPKGNGTEGMLELGRGGQWILREIIQEYLDRIDFDSITELANRWWPQGRKHPIVIDPKISFGAPIIDPVGVPTAAIAGTYLAEGSVEAVASWYELSVKQVREAVRFEQIPMAA